MEAVVNEQWSDCREGAATDSVSHKREDFDFGVIPSDWNVHPLSKLTTFISGGTYCKYVSQGIPSIGMADIQSVTVNWDNLKHISVEDFKHICRRGNPIVGDVLVSKDATIGIPIVVNWKFEFSVCGSLALIRPMKEVLSEWYLYHLFISGMLNEQICRRAKQSTIAHLPPAEIRKLNILLPAKKFEQVEIANTLNGTDELIWGLKALIEKKRMIRLAVMQELLSCRRRLPGFHGSWKKRSLGEIGSFLKGSGIKRDEANGGPFPGVRYGEIYTFHHNVIREFQSFINSKVAERATALRYGDILFAGSGETKEEIGKCVAFVHKNTKAYAGGDIIIFRSKVADPVFLGYLLNSEKVQSEKSSKGQGDAVVHINATVLSKMELEFPKIDEQRAISSVLLDVDEELSVLEATLAKISQIKIGKMQDLLTGKVRLI